MCAIDYLARMRNFICFEWKQIKIKSLIYNELKGFYLRIAPKTKTVVKYSVLQENKQLFVAKYKLYLPTEQELIDQIEREKAMIVREQGVLYGV